MQDNLPSRTARLVAQRRAAHQILDTPRVFDDPLALRIIGGDEEAIRQDEQERVHFVVTRRAFMVARSRLAEDELAEAVHRGVRQYIILGAGLDTFAYRSPFAEHVRVFEVDHPATQAWKREQLARAGIAVPPWLTFVPVDLHHTTAFDALHAGLDRSAASFCAWLGVTMYLAPQTVLSTLRTFASFPPGSGIVFDYTIQRGRRGLLRRLAFHAFASRLARRDEPWISFFDPQALDSKLRAMCYRVVDDLGMEEINRRYFSGRIDSLRVDSLMRLVSARI